MVTRPNKIPIKGAQTVQGWVFGIGAFLALLCIGAFNSGEPGPGFVMGLIAFTLFWGGSKIKTHKDWKSSIDVYK